MNRFSFITFVSTAWCSLSGMLLAQNTGPVLLEMRVPSAPADVTSSERLVHIDLQFTSTKDVLSIDGSFTHSSGATLRFGDAGASLAYHLTGSGKEGTVRLPVLVPAHASPGTWTGSVALDARGTTRYGGTGGKPFPEGSAPDLTVLNNGAVNTPPVILSTEVDRETVDVTSAEQAIRLTVAVRDETDVARVFASIKRPDGLTLSNLTLDEEARIEGTAQDGVYRIETLVPRFLPPGQYSVSCRAAESGPASLLPPEAALNDTAATITVVNSGAVDTTPPSLVSLQVDKATVNVTDQAQTVRVTVTAADTQSGLRRGSVSLVTDDGSQNVTGLTFLDDEVAPYESGQVTRSFDLTIPRHSRAGTALFTVSLDDGINRTTSYGGTNVEPFPSSAQTSLEIGNDVPEGQPAVLSSFSVTPPTLEKAGLPGLVEFRARLQGTTGIVSATAYRLISFNVPTGTRLELIDGTSHDGTWAGRILLPAATPCGEYFMWLEARDESGNRVRFGAQPLFSFTGTVYPAGWPAPLLLTPGGEAVDAYQTWTRAFPGLEGAAGLAVADADGDGFPNAVEFLCGTHPLVSTQPGGPDPHAFRLFWNPGALRMEYTPPPSYEDNATLGSGTALRLKAWKSATLQPGSWRPVEAVTDGGAARLYPLDPPAAARPAQFLRLSAEPE